MTRSKLRNPGVAVAGLALAVAVAAFSNRDAAQAQAPAPARSVPVFEVDTAWPNRLVRAEVDLDAGHIRFYALRRRDPSRQPLLREVAYRLPRRRFTE